MNLHLILIIAFSILLGIDLEQGNTIYCLIEIIIILSNLGLHLEKQRKKE